MQRLDCVRVGGGSMRVRLLLSLVACLAPLASAQDKPVITVLDFRTNGVSEKDMRSIISLLASSLFRTGQFRVIDVTQRDSLLRELEFAKSDCTDESCQLQIGRLLAAQMIVTGDLGRVGNRYLVSAKLLATETGDTLSSADGVYGSMDALIDRTFALAESLSRFAALPAKPPRRIAVTGSRSAGNAGRIAAFSCLGGAAASAGVGAFFIANAIRFRADVVQSAYQSYLSGPETYPGDFYASSDADKQAYFRSLYEAYEASVSSYQTKALVGAGLAAGGVALGGASLVLFSTAAESSPSVERVGLLVEMRAQGVSLGMAVRY